MRDFLSPVVKSIKPSGIRKFFDLANSVPGVISLGVGEPDFNTPWHIREEGIYALEKGKTFYTSNSGLSLLKEEISHFLYKRYQLSYNSMDEVLVTVGGSEAIDLALRAMLTRDDEVIIPEPSYVAYEPCTIMSLGKPVPITLRKENDFKLTKNDIEKVITANSKILVLPYPNNPTGAVLDYDSLVEIAQVCIKHDLFVISDEIYSELYYKGKYTSIASIPGMKERTLVINGFSKSFAMTGWRLGYAVGPKEIISQMLKIHQYCIMCAPTNSQFAAIEALRNGDKDIEIMKDSYNQRRRYLLSELKRIGFDCFEPYGAFYVFPSIKRWNMSSEEFATKLLKEEKVVVVPGTAFGQSGEGFIRISYAYSIDDLKKALKRIENFIKKIEYDRLEKKDI